MDPKLFDITGRFAFVTGSSRGLGLSLATGLADAGARVVLHGRDGARLGAACEELSERTGRPVTSVQFDVTDSDAVAQGLTELVATHGVPEILVNNAGIQRRAPFNEFSTANWDEIVAANLSSAFYVSRHLSPAMSERGSGKIINIASVQSMLARQTIAPYSATKGGLVMLTKGMSADLSRFGIQVNAISPGYFATEMNRDLWTDKVFDGWVKQRTPAQRWGDLSELVGTLIYLSSDASGFVNGQNIFVDGGMTSVV